MKLPEIAERINIKAKAADYRMGRFQSLRKELKGLSRVSSHKIFTNQTIHEKWAFHLGGRKEIQFNIGLERLDKTQFFRHGVAFSLETSRTLPDIKILLPKIERFNDYVRETASEFRDMRMWHWHNGRRSANYVVQEISDQVLKPGHFIFLGKRTNLAEVSIDDILIDNVLRDFDRLLNLYEYVEGGGKTIRTIAPELDLGFQFHPGCSLRPSTTTRSRPEQRLNILLRHNDIQYALYEYLLSLYGYENVGAEILVGRGKKIDIVVKDGSSYIFYEVKTSSYLQTCIREALSQLLEYSLWPDDERANKLVIVTENDQTDEAIRYLAKLRERFGLPVYHRRFDAQRKILDEPW